MFTQKDLAFDVFILVFMELMKLHQYLIGSAMNEMCVPAITTLRPKQIVRHFADIFIYLLLNENVWISIKISLNFVLNGSINNIPA